MGRLPAITARELVAELRRRGFVEHHQRGSHLYLWHPARRVLVTVPIHTGDLKRGTLRAILRQAGVEPGEFGARWSPPPYRVRKS